MTEFASDREVAGSTRARALLRNKTRGVRVDHFSYPTRTRSR